MMRSERLGLPGVEAGSDWKKDIVKEDDTVLL